MSNTTPLVPLFSKILVQRKKEEITSGGIVIPITVQEGSMKPTEGEIIAIGATVQGLAPEDKILFAKYSGSDFEFGDDKFIIMNDTDALCRIEEK